MLKKRILKEALNVKQTVIENVELNFDGSIQIQVYPTKGQRNRCGICGRKSPFYDYGQGQRGWRANDIGTAKVYLVADSPRVCCKEHGVVTSSVPWARHKSRYTYDFEQMVAWHAKNSSKTVVAQLMRISWNSIGPIISRVKEDLDPDPSKRFENLKRIGVDETSYRKGHKYMTVVVDHDTGKVIWVSQGHGKSVLTKFFKLLTKEQRASIEHVTGDGARWIAQCVEEFCPNAIRCIDPFHVVQWATESVDSVRREAWQDARKKTKTQTKSLPGRPRKGTPPKDTTASDIKGSRYALGKAPENLTANQRAKLEMIAKSDNRLYRAYQLKEKLRLVFQMDEVEGKLELDAWIGWAQRSRIPVFVDLQRKIRRHYDAIIETLRVGLSNARIEAINNKIKLSIRMAYGFRNMQNMLDMIMLRCSDIQVLLPWQ